ncbi:Imidazolonepropionase [Cyclonatronum proteinivorum]|uniref:Imidazolonepropionase n=1 Tax=Cyclonatronum proteinivorum TaxID=1457365 RepID=A0A345UPF4_9BACT|nr:amidohydrolase family protein [Cyclonatronum proteinivorum]AXJ02356.1 Imidazolonepropionase [Cyclonatronum proteinivorum]
MKHKLTTVLLTPLLFCLLLLQANSVQAQQTGVLFTNVNVFDGESHSLHENRNVLVVGNKIHSISTRAISVPDDVSVTRIDGDGRTLIPGLIDAHAHAALMSMPMMAAMTADPAYVHITNAVEAEKTLMRGFTTLRDASGPVFGLKRAIDEGLIVGPRIYPAGAMISQTAGHGDFRMPHEVPRTEQSPLSHTEVMGVSAIADGVNEVTRRAREQLMLGASHIKLAGGGGVSSMYDPLDAVQYTYDEIRAAVQAAENWGTYVMIHAYTPAAVQMAIRAGVRSIEHGQLLDEETVIMMAENDVWWSLQPFLDDEFANPKTGPSRLKQILVSQGTERAYELARKHDVRVAWGTDMLFNPAGNRNQGAQLAKLSRWFTPAELLVMATSNNAQILQLSGERNPYPGDLGVVKEGALADLLLVEGNPLEDIDLIRDPDTNFVIIMKNGRIYKNSLN